MNKKLLLTPLLLISLAFLSSGVNARVLKIATLSPDGTGWMQKMRAGAKEIKKKTDGRVVFKFYPGGVMGNDNNVLRKIRIGQLHGGAITVGSLADISPDMGIYGLPYLFSNFKEVDYVRQRLDKVMLDSLEEKGFISFGMAEAGFSYMMSDRPMRTVEDVQKQKVWIPSGNKVGEAVFNSAGVSPVPLPLSDVLTALQTGLINTVITSPIGAIALQWHTKVKYVIDVPLNYFSGTLVVTKKVFNKIKKEDQVIVRDVMGKLFKEINAQNRKDNMSAREALKNQGLEFITLDDTVLKQWYSIGTTAREEIVKTSGFSAQAYKLLNKYIDEAKKL